MKDKKLRNSLNIQVGSTFNVNLNNNKVKLNPEKKEKVDKDMKPPKQEQEISTPGAKVKVVEENGPDAKGFCYLSIDFKKKGTEDVVLSMYMWVPETQDDFIGLFNLSDQAESYSVSFKDARFSTDIHKHAFCSFDAWGEMISVSSVDGLVLTFRGQRPDSSIYGLDGDWGSCHKNALGNKVAAGKAKSQDVLLG